jgi:3-oxoacyl-[acyl-carrier-protein] synthase II
MISPVGTGKEAFWDTLVNGRSGIVPIIRFDASELPTRIAGEIKDFDPLQYIDKKEARRMDRFAHFASAATKLAVEDARINTETIDGDRVGVILGSGVGGIGTIEEQAGVLANKGPNRVSPLVVPMMIGNIAGGMIAIKYGFRGPNLTTVSACASSTNSVGEAFRLIQYGHADTVVTGGAEAPIVPIAMAGFGSMKAMSIRNDEPAKASRPFDKDRDGFVMGEGAGILILESLDHALARDAYIYAEVVGYGMTCDAYHITASTPDGAGAARAMELAIRDAGLTPQDIDYINAHGTSTPIGDISETLAIKRLFGVYAEKAAISSTKSMTGHLLGAAGGIETIICAMTIQNGVIPPTINIENPDPECDLNYVPNTAIKKTVNVAMSNSFGFGGHNATIVIKKYE